MVDFSFAMPSSSCVKPNKQTLPSMIGMVTALSIKFSLLLQAIRVIRYRVTYGLTLVILSTNFQVECISTMLPSVVSYGMTTLCVASAPSYMSIFTAWDCPTSIQRLKPAHFRLLIRGTLWMAEISRIKVGVRQTSPLWRRCIWDGRHQ